MTKIKRGLIRIIVAAVLFAAAVACNITLGGKAPQWAWAIVFAAVYLVVGYDVLIRAAKNIARGKVFDENFLMIVATVGAFAIGEYLEGVAVMLFYQVGELFQSYAVGKSRRSIAELMDICPQTACVETENGEVTVDPADVEVGSVVVVRAGEKVPIDGVITDGSGHLDCAALTGESVPVEVKAGDTALSGAISVSGALRIRTVKPYADSTAAKILDLVENASAKKAKSENFITRFAALYTPAVVIAAALIAVLPPLFIGCNVGSVWMEWVKRALTFLVVSCPCALVISVPMSFFGGIGCAGKNGILVKGGNYLELLSKTDTVIFDKTGTITKGTFDVANIVCASGATEADVLTAAAAAESLSNHPVARSIVRAALERGITAPSGVNATELAGRGICAILNSDEILCGNAKLMEERGIDIKETDDIGSTVVYVAKNGAYIGALAIADSVKEDSQKALADLRRDGIRTVMLTGDNHAVAQAVAERVGIDEFHAELLPDGKVAKAEEIIDGQSVGGGKARGKKRGAVAFVGDGINDAPVLSRADVGIAMGALGSDAAIEAADVVLMNDRLSQIVFARKIAKKTVAIVKQNIVFALAVKAIVLVLAASGIANMWLAVFADVGVAVLAILNAMRALAIKQTSAHKTDITSDGKPV